MKMNKCIILWFVIFLLFILIVNAYDIDPPSQTVHQHITNESKYLWVSIPDEIKEHLKKPINSTLNDNYNIDDDIIIGSGEEDKPITDAWQHFFNPDIPQSGVYNDSINKCPPPIGSKECGSSYQKSLSYWNNNVLPYYTGITSSGSHEVQQDQAYYWLGGIVHLIEDASQPSHVHLDIHPGELLGDDSVLEEYTADNYLSLRNTDNFKGSNFAGQQYNYESLPNLNINWQEVQPSGLTQDQLNLFKLFWYTAQKTQYFASDDADGNTTYVNLTGSQKSFSTSLWQGDGVTIIDKKDYLVQDDINDVGKNVSLEANATIPHAMKAVAGLYRLFWNTVRDQLRLQVPTEDYVFGGVKQDSYWFTELNLTQNLGTNQKLKVEIIWSDSSDLNLIVTNTTNNNVTATDNQRKETIEISSAQKGIYKLYIYGNTVSGNTYSQFTIKADKVESTSSGGGSSSGPGGINFSSIDLNYISTCNPEKGLEAVFKAKENDGTETQVNTNNATNQSINAFYTGLVIPNYKQWITMDLNTPGNGECAPIGLHGDTSRLDGTFRKTEVARVMLDADVKLKLDQFGNASDQFERNMKQDWINNVSTSPYYSQMQAKNFNSFPYGKRRTWISVANAEANGTGCNIQVTNVTLNVSYVWDNLYLNLDKYNFDQAIRDDLNYRLQGWKDRHINNHYNQVTNTTLWKVNRDPKYEELRRVAKSLTLAQWYKKLDRSKVPFGDLIDTNNLSTFNLDVGFNQAYWDDLACKYLYTQTNVQSFIPGVNYTWNWYGGVVLSLTNPNVTANISNTSQEVFNNATTKDYEIQGDNYYYGGIVEPLRPDLSILDLSLSKITPTTLDNVNVTTTIENKNVNTTNFTVYFFEEYAYSTGYKTKYEIGKVNTSINAGSFSQVGVSWNTTNVGLHNITVIADYYNQIKEVNKLNNNGTKIISVVSPYPTAIILYPINTSRPHGIVYLIGQGTDEEDEYIQDYNWTSSIQGYLGNTSILPANLSEGNHVITLTVRNSKNLTSSTQTSLSIIPSGPPILNVLSPADGKTTYKNDQIFFEASAMDAEDGVLSGTSLVWESDLDEVIGYGTSFNVNTLSSGNHTITITAIDSSNSTASKNVNIEVLEQAVNTLTTLSDGSTIKNITFNGSGNENKTEYINISKYSNITSAYLFLSGFTQIVSVKIWPTAEARNNNNFPNNNYNGSMQAAYTDKGAGQFETKRGFIRFDLNQINAQNILDVNWTVYQISSNNAGGLITVYFVSNDTWKGTDITWNNIPSMGSSLMNINFPASTTSWFGFNVTDQTKIEYSGDKNLSLAIKSPESGANSGVDIVSTRDTTWPDKYEYLNITYNSQPLNPRLDVANDSLNDWQYSSYFNQTYNKTADLSSAMNSYLNNCTADASGFCLVPLIIYSNSVGIIQISNITIDYYNVGLFPIINEVTILSNPTLPSETLEIKANVTDYDSTIREVNVTFTNTEITLIYNEISSLYEGTVTAPSNPGDYILNVTAIDSTGLRTYREIVVIVQNNQADLTITPIDIILNPENIAEPNNLTINVTVRNNGGTNASDFYVEFLIDDISQSSNQISVTAQTNTTTQFSWISNYGNQTLSFRADSTGLRAESNETNNNITKNIFVIDNIIPETPNLTADPSNWTTQDTFNISWGTLTDTNGINRYEYQIDYGNWTSTELSTSFITLSLSEGIHTIYVRGVDTPGNLGNIGNITVYRDNTAPNQPIIQEWHTGGIWTQHTDPYFTWYDPGDIGSGVTNYYGSIDNDITFSLNNSLDYHINLTTGNHTFKIYAQDAINNTSPWSNEITIYIDDTKPNPPEITSTTHSDNTTYYSNNIPIFNLTIPLDDSEIYGYYYIITDNSSLEVNENSGIFTNNTNFNISFVRNSQQNGTTSEGFPTGIWYIKVVSIDNAGNIGNISNYYKFKIDITSPVVIQTNITNSLGNITENNPARVQNITFNASITESETNISAVWLVIWQGVAELSNKLWEGFMSLVSGIWTAIIPINQTFSPTTNYTIYSNDTLGNIGSINGSFNVKIPRVNSIILNSTYNTNTIYENLTCYNYTTSADTSIYNWWLNNISDNVLNMPFDTNSSTTTNDYSGYGNNGNVSITSTIRPTWNISGYIGGAYTFDGVDDWINVSDSNSLDLTNNISIELWINPGSVQKAYADIADKGHGESLSTSGWVIQQNNLNQNQYYFAWYAGVGYQVSSTISLSANRWQHFAIVKNGLNVKAYQDGVQKIDWNATNATIQVNDIAVIIGNSYGFNRQFNGTIDEFRIYNRTLSLNEILDHNATLYNKVRNDRLIAGQNWTCQIYPTDSNLTGIPVNSTTLVISNTLPSVNNVTIITTDMTKNDTKQNVSLQISMSDPNNDGLTNITSWYVNGIPYSSLNMPFDTNNNTNAKDYSGNENNGIVTGAKWNNSGRIGRAYIFNGSTDYISIGDSNLLSFANNIMTIELWFKANRLSGQQDLVWKGTSQNEEYELYLDNNILNFVTYKPYCGAFCSRQIGFAQSGALSENQWYHVIAVRNTTTQMLYTNGNRVDMQGASSGMYNGAYDLSLGARESAFFFNGTMDNIIIYNRTLPVNEIYEHNKTNYNIIVNDELAGGQIWKAQVWANDGWGDSVSMNSSELTILNTVPVISNLILNSTDSTSNNTNQNLTLSYSIADLDGDALTNVTIWWMNNQTFANLIMPLDGGSVKDYASGITGSINGAVYSSSCRLNGCYHFNGDDNINLGAPDKLKIVHPTIEAWFKTNASAVQYIYRWRQYGIYLYLDASGSVLTTFWRSDGTPFTAGSAETYNDNNWHYAAGAYNGTDLKVYVDGVEKGTTSASGSIYYDDGIQLATIGSDGAITSYFNGFIDELRIYNMTLSPEQIALHNKTQYKIIHSSMTEQNQTWMGQVYVNDTKAEVYANSSSLRIL